MTIDAAETSNGASTAPRKAVGNSGPVLLRHAADRELARIESGVNFVLIAFVAATVCLPTGVVIGLLLNARATTELVLAFVGVALNAVTLIGYYRLTTPITAFPRETQPEMTRLVTRVLAAMALVVVSLDALVHVILGDAGSTSKFLQFVLGVAFMLVWAAQYALLMGYERWLGGRVPDRFVTSRAAVYQWLFPILVLVGVVPFLFGLSLLAAVVLHANLLLRLRTHIKSIRATGAPAKLERMGAAPA
ncbi:MAG TPA: hypothetical protein VD971_00540 [Phycisphaerales bacterium]|nr:hypothetical protein [Phycisphaerales bacterium]